MTPPIDLSDMIAEIQSSFTRLEYLASDEGPWNWQHPTLKRWMDANGFPTRDHVLDSPAATWVVLQSLRRKIQTVEQQTEQIPLPIVTTSHWGAWVDPSVEAANHG